MPRRKVHEPERLGKQSPPQTPEEQENLMIGLAMQQAEDMLREGRAPTGVLVHFLTLATEREKAAIKKLEADAEMSVAKAGYVRMQQKHEQDYQAVVDAFHGYGGNTGVLNNREKEIDYNEDYPQ